MKELRIGIVGCGRIFAMHANSVKRIKNCTLAAVCDIVEERAMDAAKQYGCNYYTSYETMAEEEQLDIVHLCLPHYLHSVVGEYYALRKVHILTEKPIDISVERAQYLIDVCKREQVKLGVIFQNRYRATNRLMKQRLEDGTLGAILGAKMSLSWNRTSEYYQSTGWKGFWNTEGGGVMIDQAIHTLDFLNWVLGGEITSVEASIHNRFHPEIEVEDGAEGIITYRQGYHLLFHAYNYYAYDANVEAEVCTQHAVVRMFGSQLTIYHNDGRIEQEDICETEVSQSGDPSKVYWGTTHIDQIQEFYEYVWNLRDQILVSGEEAMKTQRLIAAIYESGKQHCKVML